MQIYQLYSLVARQSRNVLMLGIALVAGSMVALGAAYAVDHDGDGFLSPNDPAPTNPCVPTILAPSCWIRNRADPDPDNDGYVSLGDPDDSDPCSPDDTTQPCLANRDTDGDGESDADERGRDTDNDGTPDYLESSIIDTDGDTIMDEYDYDNTNKCIPYPRHWSCPRPETISQLWQPAWFPNQTPSHPTYDTASPSAWGPFIRRLGWPSECDIGTDGLVCYMIFSNRRTFPFVRKDVFPRQPNGYWPAVDTTEMKNALQSIPHYSRNPLCRECDRGINHVIRYFNYFHDNWTSYISSSSNYLSKRYTGTIVARRSIMATDFHLIQQSTTAGRGGITGPTHAKNLNAKRSLTLLTSHGAHFASGTIKRINFLNDGLVDNSFANDTIDTTTVTHDSVQLRNNMTCNPGCAVAGITIAGDVRCTPIGYDEDYNTPDEIRTHCNDTSTTDWSSF